MRLITWNVQWCRGVDGKVSPQRIVESVRALGDFDVLCLQEVASGFREGLAGSQGEDQFALLAGLWPGYTAIDGPAVDLPAPAGRRRFGNLLLSRLPVLGAQRHRLPFPADPDHKGMPRVLVEATVQASFGPVRVLTTHLEYYSPLRRLAQARAIHALHAEACARAGAPGPQEATEGPLAPVPQTRSAILTGDLNFQVGDPEYAVLTAPGEGGASRLVDAWAHWAPGRPQPHTHAMYDRGSKPGSYACDFIFASDDLASRIRHVGVDQEVQASDHQPMWVELEG